MNSSFHSKHLYGAEKEFLLKNIFHHDGTESEEAYLTFCLLSLCSETRNSHVHTDNDSANSDEGILDSPRKII